MIGFIKRSVIFVKVSKEAVRMCSKCYEKLEHLPVKVNRIVEGKNVYCAGVYSKELQKLIRGVKIPQSKGFSLFSCKIHGRIF